MAEIVSDSSLLPAAGAPTMGPMTSPPTPSRRVVIVAYPGVQSLDVTGPLEVFAAANRFTAAPAYAPAVVSLGGGTVESWSGLGLATEPAGRSFVATMRKDVIISRVTTWLMGTVKSTRTTPLNM